MNRLREALEQAQAADTIETQRRAVENLILEASSPEKGLFMDISNGTPVTRKNRLDTVSNHWLRMPELNSALFSHSLYQNSKHSASPLLIGVTTDGWDMRYNYDYDVAAVMSLNYYPTEEVFKSVRVPVDANIAETTPTQRLQQKLDISYGVLLSILGFEESAA